MQPDAGAQSVHKQKQSEDDKGAGGRRKDWKKQNSGNSPGKRPAYGNKVQSAIRLSQGFVQLNAG
ncbi:MAG: hypothetical protein A3E78_05920 [Alphaproteobacteria bacterium RIFCSPHIGHO2_12_FULL_63_12]|nr:MAG: hypothetical protein A3E78_05920 [Alphaproteobacteria bacterium RIFCSPHIGHO2_12_FULL_63_12]